MARPGQREYLSAKEVKYPEPDQASDANPPPPLPAAVPAAPLQNPGDNNSASKPRSAASAAPAAKAMAPIRDSSYKYGGGHYLYSCMPHVARGISLRGLTPVHLLYEWQDVK